MQRSTIIFIIVTITYHDTFAEANHYLDDADLPVVVALHGRFSQDWCFYLGARESLETGDEAMRLVGNVPLVIDKDSGEIHSLGTAKPLEGCLQDYEIKEATFDLP